MGVKNQDLTHFAIPLKLGSTSADDVVIAGAYFYNHKKCKIKKAILINGATLGEDENNFAQVSVLNGSDVIASFDTRPSKDGGLSADEGVEMNLNENNSIVAQKSTLTVKYEETEGYKEITTIQTLADDSGSLDGTYFILSDNVGTVAFWIDIDNHGTSAPVHGADRAVEITTIATDDDAETVAAKVATAVDNDSKFSASATEDVVTVTDVSVGERTDAVDGDTGFTIEVVQDGEDAVSTALTDAIIILYGFFF
jgi:hypothetical protein